MDIWGTSLAEGNTSLVLLQKPNQELAAYTCNDVSNKAKINLCKGYWGKSITVGTAISLIAHNMTGKKASSSTPDKATTASPHLRKLKSICPIQVIKFFCSFLDPNDDVFRYV